MDVIDMSGDGSLSLGRQVPRTQVGSGTGRGVRRRGRSQRAVGKRRRTSSRKSASSTRKTSSSSRSRSRSKFAASASSSSSSMSTSSFSFPPPATGLLPIASCSSSSSSSSSFIPTISDTGSETSLRRLTGQRRQVEQELEGVRYQLQQIMMQMQALQDQADMLQSQEKGLQNTLKRLQDEAAGRVKSIDWDAETFPHSAVARQVLKDWFGFDQFRSLQLCAINATLQGVDAFVVMPTGSGKSLIYQLPAVVEQGKLTVVISPLLSLSRDQVIGLNKRKIPATMLSSETPKEQRTQIMQSIRTCEIRLLYITPEKIVNSKMLLGALEKLNDQGKLGRFVIDEAHCCSTMGHDFRADYRKLFILKNRFPDVPILAVTATATILVQRQIRQVLLGESSSEDSWHVFRSTFNRKNLMYEVYEKKGSEKDQMTQMANVISTRFPSQCGIIYCFSRKDTEETAVALLSLGIQAAPYHSDMSPGEKERVHTGWTNWSPSHAHGPAGMNSIQVICATSAFGMGIDKPDVRFVFHRTMPKSMEAYCQESGRAGRDGEIAHCILFYKRNDILRVSCLVSHQLKGLEKLMQIVRYCEAVKECRRELMAVVFGESFDKATQCNNKCDNCARGDAVETYYDIVDATKEAKSITQTLRNVVSVRGKGGRITMIQLVSKWRQANKTWSVAQCEQLCAALLAEGVFSITWTDNAYSTNAYLGLGMGASMIELGSKKIELFLPKKGKSRPILVPSPPQPSTSSSFSTLEPFSKALPHPPKLPHDFIDLADDEDLSEQLDVPHENEEDEEDEVFEEFELEFEDRHSQEKNRQQQQQYNGDTDQLDSQSSETRIQKQDMSLVENDSDESVEEQELKEVPVTTRRTQATSQSDNTNNTKYFDSFELDLEEEEEEEEDRSSEEEEDLSSEEDSDDDFLPKSKKRKTKQ